VCAGVCVSGRYRGSDDDASVALLVVCFLLCSQVRLVCWCLPLDSSRTAIAGRGWLFSAASTAHMVGTFFWLWLVAQGRSQLGRRLLPAVSAVRGWWSVAVLTCHASGSFVWSLCVGVCVCVSGRYRGSDEASVARLVVCFLLCSQVRLVCWCLPLIAPGPLLRGAGGCFRRHQLLTWLARSCGCGLWPKDAVNVGRQLLPAVSAVWGWWSVAVLTCHAGGSFVWLWAGFGESSREFCVHALGAFSCLHVAIRCIALPPCVFKLCGLGCVCNDVEEGSG
jgi:hypothetical protein